MPIISHRGFKVPPRLRSFASPTNYCSQGTIVKLAWSDCGTMLSGGRRGQLGPSSFFVSFFVLSVRSPLALRMPQAHCCSLSRKTVWIDCFGMLYLRPTAVTSFPSFERRLHRNFTNYHGAKFTANYWMRHMLQLLLTNGDALVQLRVRVNNDISKAYPFIRISFENSVCVASNETQWHLRTKLGKIKQGKEEKKRREKRREKRGRKKEERKEEKNYLCLCFILLPTPSPLQPGVRGAASPPDLRISIISCPGS